MKKPISFIYLCLAVLAGPLSGFGQMDMARNSYTQLSFQKAIDRYEKILSRDEDNGEAIFNLANSYRLNGEYTLAESWFQRAVELDGRPLSHLYYGQTLLINGKYAEAEKAFGYFAGIAENSNDQKRARKLAEKCREWEENGLPEGSYAVAPVPFNSGELDFSPAYFGQQTLVFVSNRKESKNKPGKSDPWTYQEFMDLYHVSVLDDAGHFSQPKSLKGDLNGNYHEGPVVFANKGRQIYFTRNDYNQKRGFDQAKNTRLKIFQGHSEDGKWVIDEPLPFNSSEFSTAHPAISPDEKVMVFASDRPGGYGGMDLYRVERQGSSWGPPENLGPEINSGGNEVFPFISEEGHLYFSSDFQVGLGGLDIYRSAWQNEEWGLPANMGVPINSPRDDFGLIVNEKSGAGYFSSNRTGRDDDIYHFSPSEKQMLKGRVVLCGTEEGIENAMVKITGQGIGYKEVSSDANGYFSLEAPRNGTLKAKASIEGYSGSEECPSEREVANGEELILYLKAPERPGVRHISGRVINSQYGTPLANTPVKLVNRCTGEVVDVLTDSEGRYRVAAPEECDYILHVDRPNFKPSTLPLSTMGLDPAEPISQDIPLVFDANDIPGLLPEGTLVAPGMVIELEHIYFDYDKYAIRADAVPELTELLEFLEANPGVSGELRAHTDARASFEYNITLSNNRARSAREWLVQRGIDPARLTSRGYGEIAPRNRCVDGVECSEVEHQRNRRVEFVVESVDGDLIRSKEKTQYLGR